MHVFYSQTCVRKFEKMNNHTSLRQEPGARTEVDKSCAKIKFKKKRKKKRQ